MHFENSELGISFDVPEPLSMRLGLRYASVVELNLDNADLFGRLWRGAQMIIVNWKCDDVPITLGPEDPMTPRAMQVVKWVGYACFSYFQELQALPLPLSSKPSTSSKKTHRRRSSST